MPIVSVLTIKAKPADYDKLKAGMAETLKGTKAYKGCLGVYAAGNPADHSVILYGRWESPEIYKEYQAWRANNGGLKSMADYFREPPSSASCEDIFA